MLSQKELEKFANKILEDYDSKNPSMIFKDKIIINNEEALTQVSTCNKVEVFEKES